MTAMPEPIDRSQVTQRDHALEVIAYGMKMGVTFTVHVHIPEWIDADVAALCAQKGFERVGNEIRKI